MIECELSPVVGDAEHVVLAGIDHAISHTLGALGQPLDHLLLLLGRFQGNIVIDCFRHGQVEHIRRLHVCDLFEHTHEFREVIELGKAGLRSIAVALRGKLDCRNRLAEGGRPGIKMNEVVPMERIVLQVFLHRVHLDHRIGDRGAGGKDNASASRQLVKVSALHIQVGAFLRFGLADTSDVPHFRECGEVLVVVRLVDEQAVNAQLFKGHDVILTALVVQFVELLLHGFASLLHCLNGKTFTAVVLQFLDALQNLLLLLLEHFDLPFSRHWDLLELRVTDDDRVVVAGGDPAAKLLSVLRFKILFRGDKNVRTRIELQILRRPLFDQVVRYYEKAFAAQAEPF